MINKGVAIAFLVVWGFFTIGFGIATAIMGKEHDLFTLFLALTIGCAIGIVISGFSAFPALLRMINERRKNKKAKKNNVHWKEREE